MRSTIRLPGNKSSSLSPPQGIFALQKSLRGDCGGDGVPIAVGSGTARAKKFPEEICFAPRRVLQICRTPDQRALKSTYARPTGKISVPGSPGVPEGLAAPLFQEESRGTPSKGFLWATSSRRLDTALLFADKKRGVETTRLAGYCQLKLAPAATDGSKKPLAAALGSKNKKRRAAFAAPKPYSYRGTMIFTAR